MTGLTGIYRIAFVPASADCDNTGVPDECQPDSDGDGVIDACDACPGTIPGVTVDASGCPPIIPGDFDRDGDVDSDDFAVFEACRTGPTTPYNPLSLPPGCTLTPDGNGHIAADFNADASVDQGDFGIFQRCYSGTNHPGDPNCAN